MPVGKSDVDFVLKIGKSIANLFSGKVSPNHWKGWNALDQKIGAPRGTNAINWVINDGDSVQSEALNIVSYMNTPDETGSAGILYMLGWSDWFKREITVEDIAAKLRKGGYPNEAASLLNEVATARLKNQASVESVNQFFGGNRQGSGMFNTTPIVQPQPIQAGFNFGILFLILGIAALVGYIFKPKGRRR